MADPEKWLKEAIKNSQVSVGILLPGFRKIVRLQRPLKANQRPIVMTPNPGDVALSQDAACTPNEYIVQNMTDRIVPFLFVAIPTSIVAIGMIPWNQALPLFADLLKRSLRTTTFGALGGKLNE